MNDRATSPAWWRGARGEWLVAGQVALAALVFLGPRHFPGAPVWSAPYPGARLAAGLTMLSAGGLLATLGGVRLGAALTALPYPKDNAPLVTTGAFGLVRHPMYSGLILASAGMALLVDGWVTWLYVAALFVLLDVKSRREERWLTGKFADYHRYQRRVRKLLPFVY